MKNMKIKNNLVKIMNNSMWDLPTPSNLSYSWNMGSMMGICLMMQILSGFLLSLHYLNFSSESFNSVLQIMQDMWSGWTLRFIHMNTASIFFMMMYLHLFRGMFYQSFKMKETWMSGVTMMMMLSMISFMGYVLPWGQMSYWAVAVITNLLSVIPLVGTNLVLWVWGGFTVGNPTLTRFYSMHFLLPFILAILMIYHMATLHQKGSSNPMGTKSDLDKSQFHPYYTYKDMLFILTTIILIMSISTQTPYLFSEPENMIPANPMQTPNHIMPEWYFMSSYAILRAMPNKTSGVIALAMSMMIFYLMPIMKTKTTSKFSLTKKIMMPLMILSFTTLTMMGSMPAEEPYLKASKNLSMTYFCSIILMNL